MIVIQALSGQLTNYVALYTADGKHLYCIIYN